ncbi:error-prone DNA polymerase [Orrella daihaiensis]|uniref:Error-prone DNA polymerase n=1 Tax=Orrella daihaiensis TaxID=2782176 RepID=A0ABY4AGS8_9BURK|nr:error-prone DNA polymerase [Orrella daihaiensis]UOD49389.1 error-prone DNA polymerase [Orrella daihaiensis]
MTTLPDYAELCCQSELSFLQGASAPEALVQQAAAQGYQALAITDECSVAGVVRAWREAHNHNLKIIIGSLFRVRHPKEPSWAVVILAKSRQGYGSLCQAITTACARSSKGNYLFIPEDLANLQDCMAILLPPPASLLNALEAGVSALNTHFKGSWWLGDTALLHANEAAVRQHVHELAIKHRVRRVAVGQVHMAKRSDKPLQDVMIAIRKQTPVHACGWDLAPNAEQHLRSRLRLTQLYDAQSLNETLIVARECEFDLGSLRYEYPTEIVPTGYTEQIYLREQTWIGAQARYPDGIPATVTKQLHHELDLIGELGYAAYFLTVYDMVRFARSRGILCQGRGSAANSAVCYCLGITEVDPQHGNTLFERFISRERNEPPDIDVDFEHQRREEVIQYLYQRYGHDRAALTAVQITYRPRSALRDVGKALGIDSHIIDRVAKSQAWWDGTPNWSDSMITNAPGLDQHKIEQWIYLARALIGKPRHRSQHPGGFVLSRGPLSQLVPIEPATMINRYVVQWDKDDLDALGLLKVDVLALGMLTVIRRALSLTAKRRKQMVFQIQDIPRHDTATFEMISRADTVGVFQIESRAQMNMLPRLKPREFYDLVIEVAIVRPGPIQGGMVHPYLRRRQGMEPITYPSAAVKSVLERTLGVPIFQEQVMKLAMVAAGFSADQADSLRRAMAAWRRRGGLEKFQQQLIDGLMRNGYSPEFAQAVFKQIQGFGEYGFPESHAASFAWLAYVSAWLKCHEPESFLVALLNSQPMGFYSPSQLIQDAQRHAVKVLPVDVQTSEWECILEPCDSHRPAVRLGFNQIKHLSETAVKRIINARSTGLFSNVDDLARRAGLNPATLSLLANSGAFSSMTAHRRQALWQAAAARHDADLLSELSANQVVRSQLSLASEAQEMCLDFQSLGFTLGRHPLSLIRAELATQRYRVSDELLGCRHGQLVRACGIVTLRQRPHTARGVMFVTLEDEAGQINVIIQPHLIERERSVLLHAVLLGVIGTWQTDGHVHHLLAGRLMDETSRLQHLGSIPSRMGPHRVLMG